MPPRGRNKANYRAANQRSERESALQRLDKVIYPNTRKYKFVRTQGESSCVVPLTPEKEVRSLTKKFLKSYYELFDEPGRPKLGSLYNADSFFSFSATDPLPTVGRNLIEILDPALRVNMLVHNQDNIAQALATFSPTEHLDNCMTFDVPFYIANPMSISFIKVVVTGVFKDTSLATNPLKAFTRVFVLKHISTDAKGEPIFQIFNDIFMLQPPTPGQIKKYHQEAQAAKKYTPGQPANSSMNTGNSNMTLSDSMRERMIRSVMSRTKMNKQGATKLLEDVHWNEDESVKLFNHVNSLGKVPQEFFTPS